MLKITFRKNELEVIKIFPFFCDHNILDNLITLVLIRPLLIQADHKRDFIMASAGLFEMFSQ